MREEEAINEVNFPSHVPVIREPYSYACGYLEAIEKAEILKEAILELLNHYECQTCGNYEFLKPALAQYEREK